MRLYTQELGKRYARSHFYIITSEIIYRYNKYANLKVTNSITSGSLALFMAEEGFVCIQAFWIGTARDFERNQNRIGLTTQS